MNMMDNDRSPGGDAGCPSDDTRDRRMGMHNVILTLNHKRAELPYCGQILYRVYPIHQTRNHDRRDTAIVGEMGEIRFTSRHRPYSQACLEVGMLTKVAGDIQDHVRVAADC